jgi:(R,R)-butanediol dehydrogenase/meso-butanediol dehydrogenase/diacetyl reductase
MQALRYHGAGDVRLEEVDEPSTGSGEVKIAVGWCGICGTDIGEYEAGPLGIPTLENPHPLTGESLPLTMGHEYSGRIVEVGDDVSSVAVGDAVAVEPLITCGACPACRAGQYNLCPQFGAVGLQGWGGGFAEFSVLPARMVHRLPEGLTEEQAALAEPITVGWHGAQKAGFRAGQTALVVGAGPIGIGCVIAARVAGAYLTLVSVRRPGARADAARAFEADAVIDASEHSVPEAVMDLTGGVGVDVVFETAGSQAGLDDAIASVRRGGTVVTLGIWKSPGSIDLTDMVMREVNLVGSLAYANEYPAVLKAIADGRVTGIERMVTRHVDLPNVVADGFEDLVENKSEHVKILVRP